MKDPPGTPVTLYCEPKSKLDLGAQDPAKIVNRHPSPPSPLFHFAPHPPPSLFVTRCLLPAYLVRHHARSNSVHVSGSKGPSLVDTCEVYRRSSLSILWIRMLFAGHNHDPIGDGAVSLRWLSENVSGLLCSDTIPRRNVHVVRGGCHVSW